jgi:hypothetical protein
LEFLIAFLSVTNSRGWLFVLFHYDYVEFFECFFC